MKNLISLLFLMILFASCNNQSNNVTPSNNGNNPAPTGSPTYSLSYTDGGSQKTYTLSPTVMIAITIFPQHANTKYGTWIVIPGSLGNSGYLNMITPLDSSDMYKIPINTNRKIYFDHAALGQSVPDSLIGNLSLEMTTSAGTDSTLNETQMTTYFSKVTSVTYAGRVYDTYNQIMSPQFVVAGVFNARIKNNVTQQVRNVTNGQYRFVIGCRPQ